MVERVGRVVPPEQPERRLSLVQPEERPTASPGICQEGLEPVHLHFAPDEISGGAILAEPFVAMRGLRLDHANRRRERCVRKLLSLNGRTCADKTR